MKNLMLLTVLGVGLMAAPAVQAAPAVSIGIGIGVGPAYVGPAPICAYGYYPFYPYACAPLGYYGPEWFFGGVFIGAGPWFHGFPHRPVIVGRPGFDVHPAFRGGAIARGPAPVVRSREGHGFRGRDVHTAPAPHASHGGRGR